MSWQTDLTDGIKDYIRKFEDADKHVEKINIMRRPRVKKECDDALKKQRQKKQFRLLWVFMMRNLENDTILTS
jgi:hypothetical protein